MTTYDVVIKMWVNADSPHDVQVYLADHLWPRAHAHMPVDSIEITPRRPPGRCPKCGYTTKASHNRDHELFREYICRHEWHDT